MDWSLLVFLTIHNFDYPFVVLALRLNTDGAIFLCQKQLCNSLKGYICFGMRRPLLFYALPNPRLPS